MYEVAVGNVVDGQAAAGGFIKIKPSKYGEKYKGSKQTDLTKKITIEVESYSEKVIGGKPFKEHTEKRITVLKQNRNDFKECPAKGPGLATGINDLETAKRKLDELIEKQKYVNRGIAEYKRGKLKNDDSFKVLTLDGKLEGQKNCIETVRVEDVKKQAIEKFGFINPAFSETRAEIQIEYVTGRPQRHTSGRSASKKELSNADRIHLKRHQNKNKSKQNNVKRVRFDKSVEDKFEREERVKREEENKEKMKSEKKVDYEKKVKMILDKAYKKHIDRKMRYEKVRTKLSETSKGRLEKRHAEKKSEDKRQMKSGVEKKSDKKESKKCKAPSKERSRHESRGKKTDDVKNRKTSAKSKKREGEQSYLESFVYFLQDDTATAKDKETDNKDSSKPQARKSSGKSRKSSAKTTEGNKSSKTVRINEGNKSGKSPSINKIERPKSILKHDKLWVDMPYEEEKPIHKEKECKPPAEISSKYKIVNNDDGKKRSGLKKELVPEIQEEKLKKFLLSKDIIKETNKEMLKTIEKANEKITKIRETKEEKLKNLFMSNEKIKENKDKNKTFEKTSEKVAKKEDKVSKEKINEEKLKHNLNEKAKEKDRHKITEEKAGEKVNREIDKSRASSGKVADETKKFTYLKTQTDKKDPRSVKDGKEKEVKTYDRGTLSSETDEMIHGQIKNKMLSNIDGRKKLKDEEYKVFNVTRDKKLVAKYSSDDIPMAAEGAEKKGKKHSRSPAKIPSAKKPKAIENQAPDKKLDVRKGKLTSPVKDRRAAGAVFLEDEVEKKKVDQEWQKEGKTPEERSPRTKGLSKPFTDKLATGAVFEESIEECANIEKPVVKEVQPPVTEKKSSIMKKMEKTPEKQMPAKGIKPRISVAPEKIVKKDKERECCKKAEQNPKKEPKEKKNFDLNTNKDADARNKRSKEIKQRSNPHNNVEETPTESTDDTLPGTITKFKMKDPNYQKVFEKSKAKVAPKDNKQVTEKANAINYKKEPKMKVKTKEKHLDETLNDEYDTPDEITASLDDEKIIGEKLEKKILELIEQRLNINNAPVKGKHEKRHDAGKAVAKNEKPDAKNIPRKIEEKKTKTFFTKTHQTKQEFVRNKVEDESDERSSSSKPEEKMPVLPPGKLKNKLSDWSTVKKLYEKVIRRKHADIAKIEEKLKAKVESFQTVVRHNRKVDDNEEKITENNKDHKVVEDKNQKFEKREGKSASGKHLKKRSEDLGKENEKEVKEPQDEAEVKSKQGKRETKESEKKHRKENKKTEKLEARKPSGKKIDERNSKKPATTDGVRRFNKGTICSDLKKTEKLATFLEKPKPREHLSKKSIGVGTEAVKDVEKKSVGTGNERNKTKNPPASKTLDANIEPNGENILIVDIWNKPKDPDAISCNENFDVEESLIPSSASSSRKNEPLVYSNTMSKTDSKTGVVELPKNLDEKPKSKPSVIVIKTEGELGTNQLFDGGIDKSLIKVIKESNDLKLIELEKTFQLMNEKSKLKELESKVENMKAACCTKSMDSMAVSPVVVLVSKMIDQQSMVVKLLTEFRDKERTEVPKDRDALKIMDSIEKPPDNVEEMCVMKDKVKVLENQLKTLRNTLENKASDVPVRKTVSNKTVGTAESFQTLIRTRATSAVTQTISSDMSPCHSDTAKTADLIDASPILIKQTSKDIVPETGSRRQQAWQKNCVVM